MIFRSVARVNDDKPDTHRFRLAEVDDFDLDDVEVFDEDSATSAGVFVCLKLIVFFFLNILVNGGGFFFFCTIKNFF